jgi:hypothetical protein
MDLGVSITTSTAIIGLAFTAVKFISVRGLSGTARAPGLYDGDKNASSRIVRCDEHSGLVEANKALKEAVNKLEERMDENFKTVFEKLDRR